jgi:CHAD domain-containing protein
VKLQRDYVEEPFVKFCKLLNRFSADAPPDKVHSLRTQARRLEASIDALTLDHNKSARRLLKSITPMRKAAGKVRDMDVLIGDVLTLRNAPNENALLRLEEHLSKLRLKRADKLNDAIERRSKVARRHLKRSSKILKKKMEEASDDSRNGQTAPQILMTELSHWPDLDEGNLHAFRIRVKELRYMLQLSADSDGKCITRLGKTKDAIGEWHDWMELLKIARKVLSLKTDQVILARIEDVWKKKLQLALNSANATRRLYFNLNTKPGSYKPEVRKARA